MMTPTLEALARQLAADPRWRWLPGMRYPKIEGGVGRRAWVRPFGRIRDDGYCIPGDAFPDLSDPVTAAALLVLAREASGDPGLHVVPVLVNGSAWWWTVVTGRAEPTVHRHHESEIEALAAAILRGGE